MSEVTLLGMIKHLPKLHRAVMEYDQMRLQICELKDERDKLRTEKAELEKWKSLTICHAPHEAAIATLIVQCDQLRAQVRGAKVLRDSPKRVKWNPDGYWLDEVCVGSIEAAFEKAGGRR